MSKGRRALMVQSSAQAGDRTLGALRPGVEAILLAAVALGCAQAGWEVMSPRYATAANPPPTDDIGAAPSIEADAEFVSPFAPDGAGGESASSAANAILGNLKLVGVRMSADPERSGAIIDQGGQQSAFGVGDDLGAGIELVAVRAEGIEVSIAGARRMITLAQDATGPSFARAMMGLSPVDAAPQVEVAANEVDAAPAVTSTVTLRASSALEGAPTVSGNGAGAMLAGMGAPEYDASGALLGWRVSDAAPAMVRAAGLQPGDLVVEVNGASPGAMASAMSQGMAQGSVTLTVRRDGDAQSLIRLQVGAPT